MCLTASSSSRTWTSTNVPHLKCTTKTLPVSLQALTPNVLLTVGASHFNTCHRPWAPTRTRFFPSNLLQATLQETKLRWLAACLERWPLTNSPLWPLVCRALPLRALLIESAEQSIADKDFRTRRQRGLPKNNPAPAGCVCVWTIWIDVKLLVFRASFLSPGASKNFYQSQSRGHRWPIELCPTKLSMVSLGYPGWSPGRACITFATVSMSIYSSDMATG